VFSRTTEPACADTDATNGCSTTTDADKTSSLVLPESEQRSYECPAGGYCVAGSGLWVACVAGTYNAVPGQREVADCLSCPAGKYCSGPATAADIGNSAPDGTCSDGYYCVAGSSSATQAPASVGHYARAGFASEAGCAPGSYQGTAGQSSCVTCEAGKYCPGFGNTANAACPNGYYCPSETDKPIPCPKGTFDATGGLTQSSECTP
jgi:hypothetical protein